jgi:hypothetical protein
MKTKPVPIFIVICCLFSFNLLSCKEEDLTPPELSLTTPHLNDTLRNEIEIAFDAKDNEALSYVEVYANDSLLGTVNPPLNSFKWNSLEVNDGEYVISCKAFDKSGNSKEDEKTITIENALIKGDISELFGAEYNLLVTDSLGNALAKTTFKTNDKFILKPTTFYNKSTINIIYFLKGATNRSIHGYLNVKRGFNFSYGSRPITNTPNIVNVHIKKTDISFSEINISTDGAIRVLNSLNDTVTPTQLNYSHGHDILVQLFNQGSKLYKFFPINNNQHVLIDLSEVNLPMEKKTINFPANHTGSCLLTGVTKSTDITNQYYLHNYVGNYYDDKVDVYYPLGFNGINSFIGCYDKTTMSHYNNMIKGEIPQTFEPLSINYQMQNSQATDFSMTLNGVADYYILAYKYNNNEFLNIYSTTNLTKFKFPDLATIYSDPTLAISKFILKDITFNKINDMPQDKYLNSYIYPESYLIPWKKSQSKYIAL